jgi:hypothetical protein
MSQDGAPAGLSRAAGASRAGPGRGRTILTPTSEAQRSGGEDTALVTRAQGSLMSAHHVCRRSPQLVRTSARTTPAAERMYGYSSREIIGRSIDLLAPPDRAGEVAAMLARIILRPSVFVRTDRRSGFRSASPRSAPRTA